MRIIVVITMCAMTTMALAQGGLSQGAAIKNPTANPVQSKKTCSQCGITMGNVTYAWQHESWCPYYKSKSSFSRKSSTGSTEQLVTNVAAATVASALGNWLSSEPQGQSGNFKRYFNDNPGQSLDERSDPKTGKDVPRYVVLRDSKKDKLGVWKNAWTYVESDKKLAAKKGATTDYPGHWMLKPKYDFINLRFSGLDNRGLRDDCVAIVGLKSGKGADAPMKYGLLSLYEYNGSGSDYELVPLRYTSFAATTPKHKYGWGNEPEKWKGGNLMVIFGNPNQAGKMIWGVWRLRKKDKPGTYSKMEAYQLMPDEFDSLRIINNYIYAWKEGKCGLYDEEGKELLPIQYANIGLPIGDQKLLWAQREKGGKYGIVDVNGQEILPFEYNYLSITNNGIITKKQSKYGFVWQDKSTVPMIYDNISDFELEWNKKVIKRFLIAEKDGQCGYIVGQEFTPFHIYDEQQAEAMMKDSLLTISTFSKWYEEKTDSLRKLFRVKGEFEKQADYQKRMDDPAALAKYLGERMKGAVNRYTYEYVKDADIVMGTYDAEHEYFPIYARQAPWNAIRLPIPISEAAVVKKAFTKKERKFPTYFDLRLDTPDITEITIVGLGKISFHF